MKAEENFIRKLESYLDEDFNEFTKNRIRTYLNEYREEIPPLVIKQKNEKPDIKIEDVFFNKKTKNYITNELLIEEARKICEQSNVSIDEFIVCKSSKIRNDVGELRKKFCNLIHEKYLCSNMSLAKFFNVHHSTISFYLYGKTRTYIKQRKK